MCKHKGEIKRARDQVLFQQKVKVKVSVAQSCPTLLRPADGCPSDFSVHAILQARILQWVTMPSSRGSALTQGSNTNLPRCRQILYHLMHPVLLCYSYSLAFLMKTNYLPKSYRSSSASWGEVVGGRGVCGLRQILVRTNYYQISHNSDTMDLVCLIISVVNSKSLPG